MKVDHIKVVKKFSFVVLQRIVFNELTFEVIVEILSQDESLSRNEVKRNISPLASLSPL